MTTSIIKASKCHAATCKVLLSATYRKCVVKMSTYDGYACYGRVFDALALSLSLFTVLSYLFISSRVRMDVLCAFHIRLNMQRWLLRRDNAFICSTSMELALTCLPSRTQLLRASLVFGRLIARLIQYCIAIAFLA